MARQDEGTVHMIEAALASIMVLAALFYVNSMVASPVEDRTDGLESISSDVINVLEYRANSIEHPALGFALSSNVQWDQSSGPLAVDIGHILPAGIFYYVETPYGAIGQKPANGVDVYTRPFVAYGGPGNILDCKLSLWRP